jgi:hypothetical protein
MATPPGHDELPRATVSPFLFARAEFQSRVARRGGQSRTESVLWRVLGMVTSGVSDGTRVTASVPLTSSKKRHARDFLHQLRRESYEIVLQSQE